MANSIIPNNKIDVTCRLATSLDIPLVASIHVDAFPGFFLTQLGCPFLRVMYRAFLSDARGIFVVAECAEGGVVGFAVGALHGRKDRMLAMQYLPMFFLAALPAVLSRPVQVLRRLCARFFNFGELVRIPKDAAALRSIGVMPSMRGMGAASLLLEAFEKIALSKKVGCVYLTTDEVNNQRAQQFYSRSGYSLVSRFKQDGQRWMWLMSKKIKD